MKTRSEDERRRYSRRGFLKRAGAGAGAVALSGTVGAGTAPRAAAARSGTVETRPTTFGRMFRNQGEQPKQPDAHRGHDVLRAVRRPRHHVRHRLAAGRAHRPGRLGELPVAVARPRLLVLAGPVASPQLYDPADRDKLRIGFGGLFEDLPRVDDGTNTAIVADPRNDEQMMIAGLQCAFILFHNNAVDWARNNGYGGASTFSHARQVTTWHYHWLVLHEYLPQIVGLRMVDDVLRNGRRFYKPRMREGFIPVEFQAGAYRFGHSMVRIARISRATTASRSSRWSSTRPARVRRIQSTCAAALAPRAASSAGRRSSTSAMGR
jgi:hypothetical protein